MTVNHVAPGWNPWPAWLKRTVTVGSGERRFSTCLCCPTWTWGTTRYPHTHSNAVVCRPVLHILLDYIFLSEHLLPLYYLKMVAVARILIPLFRNYCLWICDARFESCLLPVDVLLALRSRFVYGVKSWMNEKKGGSWQKMYA